ncbi:plastocyanin/azurin family copper-binding protein [Halorussus gelatinilyticus]|uniref:Plastocyanin/azurin family copper-binding protein n=1 Tax=Halorussus gelatinilyticus TaxID=2937524 RepID=A0A8U0IF22_9EURY|nr:plastocyanin/azurin family copper-binding protein [Halorussus gelatinilyticus]UPV99497.1 plastocyanin/azurin family copper-binding protein [Halorussus gelatinilyticus]
MAATGVAGGGAAGATAAAAQETTETSSGNTTASGNETTTVANGTAANETTASGGSSGGGPTKEVIVGPGGSLVFEPAELTIATGTTVKWVWESDNHNVVPSSQPEGANWQGTDGPPSKTYNTGHEYSHTFNTTGTFEYFCQPHKTAGMTGTITVKESLSSGGGGQKEANPEHMGVPIQAHFVGLAALLMMAVSFVYTFFTLKYGESPHASGGN